MISFIIWIIGAIPFVLVMKYRKHLPAVWIFDLLTILIFLLGLEIGFWMGPFRYQFLPNDLGKNFKPHSLLLWVPADFGEEDETAAKKDFFEQLRFRSGPVKITKEPNAFRILVLGGSNTAGSGIDQYEDTFCGLMDKALKDRFPERNSEVICAGIHSYSAFQNLEFYKLYLHRFKPDLIVLYANMNDNYNPMGHMTFRETFRIKTGVDISDLGITKELDPDWEIEEKGIGTLLSNIKLYNLLVQTVTRFRDENLPDPIKRSFLVEVNPVEDYRKNLVDLAEIAQSDGADILFADEFNIRQSDRASEIRSTMEQASLEMGVPFLPVHSKLITWEHPEQFHQKTDRWHLGKKGHETIAELLLEEIVKTDRFKQ